jgi:hypothetical protein
VTRPINGRVLLGLFSADDVKTSPCAGFVNGARWRATDTDATDQYATDFDWQAAPLGFVTLTQMMSVVI